MAALLHLDGLGAPITHDFENGWALFCSMLLLRDDFVGPVPVPPPSPGATVRICGESWGKVEAIVMAKPRVSPDTASATGRAVELTEQPSWLTPAQAATRLGMPRAALERLRKGVPGNLPGAPVNQGSGAQRSRWRWRADTIETWLEEVQKWQALNGGAKGIACAGETPMGGRGAASVQTRARPPVSGRRSSRRMQKEDGGSLVTLVRSLNSTS